MKTKNGQPVRQIDRVIKVLEDHPSGISAALLAEEANVNAKNLNALLLGRIATGCVEQWMEGRRRAYGLNPDYTPPAEARTPKPRPIQRAKKKGRPKKGQERNRGPRARVFPAANWQSHAYLLRLLAQKEGTIPHVEAWLNEVADLIDPTKEKASDRAP